MKIFGKRIEGPNTGILVIPREGGDIVFKAQAVLDYTIFDGLCPKPSPPKLMKRGSTSPIENINDPTFLSEVEQYSSRKIDFMILQSLSVTPGLEWETVDINNPDTWNNYKQELQNACFTNSEINLIIGLVFDVNSLDEDKLEQARQRFLALEQEVPSNGISPKDGHKIMQSGELVKDSE